MFFWVFRGRRRRGIRVSSDKSSSEKLHCKLVSSLTVFPWRIHCRPISRKVCPRYRSRLSESVVTPRGHNDLGPSFPLPDPLLRHIEKVSSKVLIWPSTHISPLSLSSLLYTLTPYYHRTWSHNRHCLRLRQILCVVNLDNYRPYMSPLSHSFWG